MVFSRLRLDSLKVLHTSLGKARSSLLEWWSRAEAPPAAYSATRSVAGTMTPPPPVKSPPSAPSRTESEHATLASPRSEREPELRHGELRARFDALFDRLLAVEDTVDALGKRIALRGVHERRAEQRAIERLESLSEVLERRNLELEAFTAAFSRLEVRLERLERRRRHDDPEPAPREAARTEFDEIAPDRASIEARRPSRHAPDDTPELWDVAPFSASSMRGNLSEVSLPTVLGMLELERRTGVLKLCADDGALISATLRDGKLVGARVREVETEPLAAIREALRFTRGHFWFRQLGVELASGPPKSVGSVLLEATRQNDEALRSA